MQTQAKGPEASRAAELGEAIAADAIAMRREFVELLGEGGQKDLRTVEHIGRMVTAELWRADQAKNAAQWVSAWTGWSNHKARRVISCAHELPRLPHLRSALGDGSLCLDKVVELARFATPEEDSALVVWAMRTTLGGIRDRADRAARRDVAEAKDAHESRRVDTYADRDRWFMEAEMPIEDGVKIDRAIRDLAGRLPAAPPEEGEDRREHLARTAPQRRADAFFALTALSPAAPDLPASEIALHVTLDDIAAEDGVVGMGPGTIHTETLRRLTCDCHIQVVTEDEDGRPLGAGDRDRNIPRRLRRQMLRRDGHRCTFPGCESRARELAGHHVEHWGREGETELYNLISLCPYHHYLVHEGGWSVVLTPKGSQWFRPSGRRYEPGVPPSPKPPSPPSARTIAEGAGYSRLFDLLARRDGPRDLMPPQLIASINRNREDRTAKWDALYRRT